MPPYKNIVIIGNGISGITAARYIRKRSDAAITVISAESKYFHSRTALMYIYMGHMTQTDTQPYEPYFWEKNRIGLIQAWVESIDTQNKSLALSSGKTLEYDALVIACGSEFNTFGWPGQDLRGVGGLYSLQDLAYMEEYTRNINHGVIVGGGLIGIEMAEMLQSRGIGVTFLVREESYWDNVLPKEESEMVNRHIREHHIDLRLSTELAEIIGDEYGRVNAVKTNAGETIACEFVGLTAGVHPNIDWMRSSGIEVQKGILVDRAFATSAPGVFAIGDCAQFRDPLPGRAPIEQVWYTGKMHGETVALTLTGTPTEYDPGIWFNSAKFLDIEYQVYGDIPRAWGEDISTLYWEHPEGRHSIRINYETKTNIVTGFNLMGVRFRHKVCEAWIARRADMHFVLTLLRDANFDPEFFPKYEKEIVKLYNAQNAGNPVKLKPKWTFLKTL